MQRKARQLLVELERDGNFVFHGSSKKLDIVEPRQATNFVHGKSVPDDRPGIHASNLIDVAIFMAIINQDNCLGKFYGSFGYYGKGSVVFEVTKETLEQLTTSRGYVYAFSKSDFKKRNDIEYIAYCPVEPVERVKVGIADLPAGLNVKE